MKKKKKKFSNCISGKRVENRSIKKKKKKKESYQKKKWKTNLERNVKVGEKSVFFFLI